MAAKLHYMGLESEAHVEASLVPINVTNELAVNRFKLDLSLTVFSTK